VSGQGSLPLGDAPWSETRAGQHRIRWRSDGSEHADPLTGYIVEHKVEGVTDWRQVRNRNSLDWFALGLRAATRHDCGHWRMEGIGCADCNPIARELPTPDSSVPERGPPGPVDGSG
jgi:hypothetical protein